MYKYFHPNSIPLLLAIMSPHNKYFLTYVVAKFGIIAQLG